MHNRRAAWYDSLPSGQGNVFPKRKVQVVHMVKWAERKSEQSFDCMILIKHILSEVVELYVFVVLMLKLFLK